ncbi:HSP20-like chaperone [Trametes punicea]|nr:HSP20-like chaperone [Trametes punicea]
MSPQYTRKSITTTQPLSIIRYSMSQGEDPRFRAIDRILARAYLQLRKREAEQKRAGIYRARMDIYDDSASPYITAILELPGMKMSEVSVCVEDGQLVVHGERIRPHLHARPEPNHDSSEPTTSNPYPVQEIKYGKVHRELPLPNGVTLSHVRSSMVDGMLTITWPRNPAIGSGQPSSSAVSVPAAAAAYTHARRDDRAAGTA